MMGFRDPNNDPQDVADYWDEILHEFGIQAYLDAREEQYAGRDWSGDNVGDNGDMDLVGKFLEEARADYREALNRLADC